MAIVLLAIIPAIGLIYYSAAERKNQISVEIEGNALRLSSFLASNLERDISEGRGFMTATAELLGTQHSARGSCEEILSNLLKQSTVYANLGVSGPDGQIMCSAQPPPKGAHLNKLNWFGAFHADPVYTVGFDFNSQLSKDASIILMLPITSKGTHQRHILFAVMDLDWLNTLAKTSQLPPGYAISVTNRSGEAMARYPDPDMWVGKPYPMTQGLQSNRMDEGVTIANGIDGIKRVYANAPVAGSADMVVHVGIRREEIWAPANRALIKQLIALGFVSLLALLASWFGSDVFLLKQIRVLITATKDLTSGNLSARSSLSYDRGELGDLARAFDEMAETLEWRDAQLRESENERFDPIAQFSEFVEFIPAPFLILNGSLEIVSCNSAVQELFGNPKDSIIGTPIINLCPELPLKKISTHLNQGIHGSVHSAHFKMWTMAQRMKGPRQPVELSFCRSIISKKPAIMVLIRSVEESRSAV